VVKSRKVDYLSLEFRITLYREILLFWEIPEFLYKTMYDKPSVASVSKSQLDPCSHFDRTPAYDGRRGRQIPGHSIHRAMHMLFVRRAVKLL